MMPAIPSGSYLADGLAITSMRSMVFAGSVLRYDASCAPRIGVGRPLIWTTTFSLPRRLTLPSMSTCTDGTFSSSSLAFAAPGARSFARYALRSGSVTTVARSSFTVTASRITDIGASFATPRSRIGVLGVSVISWITGE